MRVTGARLYPPIIGTAATAAAATGHTIILSLASAGAFSGTYASYRHGSVPFALAVVCAVVSSFAVCASIGAIRRSLGSRAEAREFASRLPGDPNASTYFAALGVQFAVLLTLESLEQTLQFGHPLGLAASL